MCVHTKWVHTYQKLTRIETKLLNVVTTEYSVERIKGKLKFLFIVSHTFPELFPSRIHNVYSEKSFFPGCITSHANMSV